MDFSIVLLILLLLISAVSGNVISCNSSGTVQAGDSATVTCNFHMNLRKAKTGFYVYRYQYDDTDPDVPVICDWEGDSLSCETMAGYEVKLRDERVMLNISSAQQTHAGRFVCKTFEPEDSLRVEDCRLTVQVGVPEKGEENTAIYCHTKAHTIHGLPMSMMCLVPNSLHADSIILERHASLGNTEEIARCNRKTESCMLNMYGYQVTNKLEEGFGVIIAMVDKAGRYVCRAEGKDMQTNTCSLSFDAGSVPVQGPVCDRNSEEPFENLHIALTGLFVLNVVLIVVVVLLWCRLRKPNLQNLRQKPTTDDPGELNSMLTKEKLLDHSVCMRDN